MDLQRDSEDPAAEPQPLPALPAPPSFLPVAIPQNYDLIPSGIYAPRVPSPPKPGQLTPAWRTLFTAGWVGVILGFAAVWQASRISGISPWWLGPETNQRLFAVMAIPFFSPVSAIVAATLKLRVTAYVGVVAALGTGTVALGDRTRFSGIAAVEGALACAGLVISVGAFAGRMRKPI